jgi:hypothetical protein
MYQKSSYIVYSILENVFVLGYYDYYFFKCNPYVVIVYIYIYIYSLIKIKLIYLI